MEMSDWSSDVCSSDLRDVGMPMTFPRIDVRVDAAAKKIVEIGTERLPFKYGATNLVPRKRRQMTNVKNKWMAPNDRLSQDFSRRNDRENLIGSRPRREKSISQ